MCRQSTWQSIAPQYRNPRDGDNSSVPFLRPPPRRALRPLPARPVFHRERPLPGVQRAVLSGAETAQPAPGNPRKAESKLDRYHVAGHIREIRELRGLSQRGLAERMGAPRTYISKIEGGKCLPTLYGAGLGWGEPDPRAGALRRGVGRWVGRDCGACTWRGALGANRADSRGRARRGGGRGLTLTESRLRASHKTFPPAPTRVRNHITPNGDACYCRD